MLDGLLRVSEAASIDVADLETEGEETITVRRSKTDQEGAAQYVGPTIVACIRAWHEAAAIVEGALFQRLDKAGVA